MAWWRNGQRVGLTTLRSRVRIPAVPFSGNNRGHWAGCSLSCHQGLIQGDDHPAYVYEDSIDVQCCRFYLACQNAAFVFVIKRLKSRLSSRDQAEGLDTSFEIRRWLPNIRLTLQSN